MANMSKQKKLLVITILCISVIQMPFMALMPAIAGMAQVFSDRSLSEIQTAVSLSSLISMVSSLLSAVLIGRRLISKKTAVLSGLVIAILTSVAAILLHTQFWHLCAFSVMLGLSMGFFIPATASIMFDALNEEELQKVTGYQTSFTNIGGIVMSAVGGVLTTLVWYGGYLAFLLMIPVAVLAAVTLPGKKTAAGDDNGVPRKRSKLPGEVAYYGVLLFLFMMIYNVCGNNASTHLAENSIGNAATAGLASAVQMAGGVASGLVFSKLSAKFRDYTILFAFLAIFVGLTVLNLGHASLTAVFVGMFIVGSSLSMMVPQCMFAVSRCVDPSNSSAATTIVSCIAPGAGAFLSPVVFTNLTMWLGGASTNFRYQFVAIAALVVGVAIALNTMRLEKRAHSSPLSAKE
ncbi:Predicted arabinose efflux permease, MFS family [Sporobacter termitidis DSM 10068]|uniref:Predicted arabinose efflux permease, MFS family n=1 Tax=Sporobacter termitidis DSM 10068 TaxID=1123282 RepID=A0A1M5Z7J2_9FIRM|nr:MFS transporter [Sporobacter termitidis]SHI20058.1 Predicted arabinose efflux permease, MFS family [Sporobacter termitidis DSM 10068]